MDREVSSAEALTLPDDVRNIPNNEMDEAVRAVAAGTASPAQAFYGRCSGPRIDYIWVSDGVRVLDYETVSASRPGRNLYPSDHFPITATILLP